MHVKYYIIRGRGEGGLKFQLARLEDEQGNNYKGLYDMAKQFASVEELKTHIADVVKVAENDLQISAMNL